MVDERLERSMREGEAIRDTRLLGDFSVIYCEGVHPEAERAPLVSDGVALGVYKRVPKVCDECAELLRYAERRRAYCPKDPKPFCSYCDTHCYKPDMRERMREVMRYAGPRSWRHGYAIEGVRHVIAGKRFRKQMERAAARRVAGSAPGTRTGENRP